DPTALAKHNLLVGGGKLQELTIDDIIVNFSRQDAQALYRRNPALSSQDIKEIYQDIGKYLLLATHKQQTERAKIALAKVKAAQASSNKEELADLTKQLWQTLSAKREFDSAKNLPILVFEYYANIKLRKN